MNFLIAVSFTAGLAPATEVRGDYYRWLFFATACLEPAAANHAAGWDPEAIDLKGRFGYGSYDDVLNTLAGWLKGKQYVAGDAFTAADVYLGSHLNFGMMFNVIEKRPEFVAYWDGLKTRPAFLRAGEQIQKMMPKQA